MALHYSCGVRLNGSRKRTHFGAVLPFAPPLSPASALPGAAAADARCAAERKRQWLAPAQALPASSGSAPTIHATASGEGSSGAQSSCTHGNPV